MSSKKYIDIKLKISLLAGLQYNIFNNALITLNLKDKKRYDQLMQDLRIKGVDAELELDYLEKITSNHFMKPLTEAYELLRR